MSYMSNREMGGLDRWITDGNSHYCEFCKTHWSDCDGGCECQFCTECEERYGSDEYLSEDGVCETCINTSCNECGDAKGVFIIDAPQCYAGFYKYCPACYQEQLRGEK